MKKQIIMPRFKNESQEADWWASREGRDFVKRRFAETKSNGTKAKGSSLVARLGKKNSVQISLRLPEAELRRARRIATRKGIGYQTLLKMLVHEGLERESRSA